MIPQSVGVFKDGKGNFSYCGGKKSVGRFLKKSNSEGFCFLAADRQFSKNQPPRGPCKSAAAAAREKPPRKKRCFFRGGFSKTFCFGVALRRRRAAAAAGLHGCGRLVFRSLCPDFFKILFAAVFCEVFKKSGQYSVALRGASEKIRYSKIIPVF